MTADPERWDVLVVGGGPAGLSAALVLGRARRSVLVCDTGRPRNAASQGLHGYLTRDGILPSELLQEARDQLGPYPSVRLRHAEVLDVEPGDGEFTAVLADGARVRTRKVLLATGVVDELPEVEGLRELYGRSVHHCPYCDGWEWRDQPLALYGRGSDAAGAALGLTLWSRDVVLCTDGPAGLRAQDRGRLRAHGIAVREERIRRLEGCDGRLERIVFEEGEPLPRRALFLSTGQRQHSPLPAKLGCVLTDKGTVRTGKHEATNVKGVYVAGDASKNAQLVIVAAAEGAQAAVAINTSLMKEDLARADARRPVRGAEPAGRP